MLDVAGTVGPVRDRIIGRVADLETALQATPVEFSSKLAATGTVLSSEINDIAQSKGDGAADFLALPEVRTVMTLAQSLAGSGGQISAEEELNTYRRTGTALGKSKIGG
jgi:hypothetical protein